MKILFVASECTPIAKVGGLGDVIGSLPKALSKLGAEVKIIIPFYESIDRRKYQPKIVFKLDEETVLYKTRISESRVEVFLVYNKDRLSTGPIYFDKSAFVQDSREMERFLFFSKTVFQLLKDGRLFKPDIVHCHDWHTGALATLLRGKIKTVFTIHNLANQGKFNGRNLMAEGILNADKITTVSETYAKEILTKKYGDGLENLLKKRRKNLIGILNGIDYSFWPRKVHHHGHNKNSRPRFGFIARLTEQKGLGLILPIIPAIIKKSDAQFYFLGQGNDKYEKAIQALAEKYPKNIELKIGFDEKRAHKIYAESDFFLMPSLFEPSGLGQMISMRYGTIPIVRATGGLKDSVKHLKTGLVFKGDKPQDLFASVETALKYFHQPEKLAELRKNCLNQDFSWEKSAKNYIKIYKELSK